MSVLRAAALLAGKDLRIELRTREITVSTGLFAVLVVVLTSLSFYVDDVIARRIAPGVLWIAIAFAGVLAIGRTWGRERENDAMRGLLLSPIPRPAIFAGKAVGTFAFLIAIEMMLVPLVAVLFHLDLVPALPLMIPTLLLGSFGFVLTGTLFGAMTVRTRSRDLMLSVVLFPLVTPALLAGVVATRGILGGDPLEETLAWLRILGAYDLVVGVCGWFLFGPLVSD
ncbi:heme exporter protein CcmB [Sandaracinus amylolyticus]|uniref:Heme exporter protein B n=1 Tax=Sandaracinus amylolyticus TaxID=927083 RepID=A0A0F6W6R5_9BACT|nr:heme exporter protein CcmB [Sandaracinus amylolyticus]AKF08931.1 ABC transporter in cytochrome c biogenesis, CcmB subunit [Sandaracinus amylolyticus]